MDHVEQVQSIYICQDFIKLLHGPKLISEKYVLKLFTLRRTCVISKMVVLYVYIYTNYALFIPEVF